MAKLSVFEYVQRYLMLICGLIIMAFGVALSIKANMGISPISTLPYVLNQTNNFFTVGQYTAGMHILFVLIQIILLRSKYERFQLLQLGIAVILGALIDLFVFLISPIYPQNYFHQLLLFFSSVVLVGFGMFLEVKASVLMVAGEGMVKAIAAVTGIEFGKIKIINDCTLVAISLLIGLIFSGRIIGIREGTVLAAVLVGTLIKIFNDHLNIGKKFN